MASSMYRMFLHTVCIYGLCVWNLAYEALSLMTHEWIIWALKQEPQTVVVNTPCMLNFSFLLA